MTISRTIYDEFGEAIAVWRDLEAEQREADAAATKRQPDRRVLRWHGLDAETGLLRLKGAR